MPLFPAYAAQDEGEPSHIQPDKLTDTGQVSCQLEVPETEQWDIQPKPKVPETEEWDIEPCHAPSQVEKETKRKSKKRKREHHSPKKAKKKKSSKEKRRREKKEQHGEDKAKDTPLHDTEPQDIVIDPTSDFYFDAKGDCLLYPTATLYFPIRPKYVKKPHSFLVPTTARRRRRRLKRYFTSPPVEAACLTSCERAAAALRIALVDSPDDPTLWETYLDYMERFGDARDTSEEAERAAALPSANKALRQRAHEALWRALPSRDYVRRVQNLLQKEKRADARAELWVRLSSGAAWAAGDVEGDTALRKVLTAALSDCRVKQPPALYPALLYIYGASLRSSGRWERLSQLVELVVAMNAASPSFPPPHTAETEARLLRAEDELAQYELKAVRSGLPLGEVWCRVERARVALHWRADTHPALSVQDPDRGPHPGDIADLLLPVPARTALRVATALLRLVEVPVLPVAGYVHSVIDSGRGVARESVDRWSGANGASLLALFRAARRLLPGHPLYSPDAAAVRALLAKTPMRKLAAPDSDPTGFEPWREALWEAVLRWTEGRDRLAIVAWRLRYIHARVLVSPLAERAVWKKIARHVAKEHAPPPTEPSGSLALSLLARVESAAGDTPRAIRTAWLALSAALQHGRTSYALFAARVVNELDGSVGLCAIVNAVRGPPIPQLPPSHPPSKIDIDQALTLCEERCAEIEKRLEEEEEVERDREGEEAEEDEDGALVRAFLPGEAEWGACRAALASPSRIAQLVKELQTALNRRLRTAYAQRYWEQSACALAAAAAAIHRTAAIARNAAVSFPHNGYLILAGAGAPLWLGLTEPRLTAGSELSALGEALPALLAAEVSGMEPHAAEKAARVSGRAGSLGYGGATLALLRLHAAARAPAHHTALSTLTAALDMHPHAKELYVSGASLWPAMAEALPDLALDRGLRLHALPDELAPLQGDTGDNRDPATHSGNPGDTGALDNIIGEKDTTTHNEEFSKS